MKLATALVAILVVGTEGEVGKSSHMTEQSSSLRRRGEGQDFTSIAGTNPHPAKDQQQQSTRELQQNGQVKLSTSGGAFKVLNSNNAPLLSMGEYGGAVETGFDGTGYLLTLDSSNGIGIGSSASFSADINIGTQSQSPINIGNAMSIDPLGGAASDGTVTVTNLVVTGEFSANEFVVGTATTRRNLQEADAGHDEARFLAIENLFKEKASTLETLEKKVDTLAAQTSSDDSDDGNTEVKDISAGTVTAKKIVAEEIVFTSSGRRLEVAEQAGRILLLESENKALQEKFDSETKALQDKFEALEKIVKESVAI